MRAPLRQSARTTSKPNPRTWVDGPPGSTIPWHGRESRPSPSEGPLEDLLEAYYTLATRCSLTSLAGAAGGQVTGRGALEQLEVPGIGQELLSHGSKRTTVEAR